MSYQSKPLSKLSAAVLAGTLLTGLAGFSGASCAEESGQAQSNASFERFKNRVENIVKDHEKKTEEKRANVEAKMGETDENDRDLLQSAEKTPKIERIVDMGISKVRAVKGKDGTIMFIADMGRFVFTGSVYDLWQKKQLTTIDEISDAVSRIDLSGLNLRPEAMNLARVGTGKKHVTLFVDPLCGWCHKLMNEVVADVALKDEYTFDFLVIPALGKASDELSKRLFCSETDPAKRFEVLRGGRDAIEKLPAVSQACKSEGYDRTKMTSTFLGVQAVPFVIAPDGRFSRGKPANLRAFLEGNASDGNISDLRAPR